MKLGIVGTGTMGQVLYNCATSDNFFDEILMIEPAEKDGWPSEKLDLLIDFSNPKAIYGLYEYCRKRGGNIPIILATTGYEAEEEKIIDLLCKICPVERKTNFSQGVDAMNRLTQLGVQLLGDKSDIRVSEIHHTKKKDAPSGTAKTLCHYAGIGPEEYAEKTEFLRMGTVFGQHTVYFAMEDEVLEIRHTAYSKRIFALGALEAGKKMLR